MIYTPPEVAQRWGVKPESVIALIKAGRLAAFTVSPVTSRRPRWRITAAAVEAYEQGKQEPQTQPVKRQRRRNLEVVEFYK